MNKEVLKELLAVQTYSGHEEEMVEWLCAYIAAVIPEATVRVDEFLNVYVTKGSAEAYPCVAAHIDSVQPFRRVSVIETGDILTGFDTWTGRQCGLGADDKTGVFVCLNLLERCDAIRAVFFAMEEIGCRGAAHADPDFMRQVGYLIEYDCPSRNMLSYTLSGVRLFENSGAFIQTALPVLRQHGTTLWQHHPFTDAVAIRRQFPISCLNLSSGYYNWHAANECVSLSDVQLAIDQGIDLIAALGATAYPCPIRITEQLTESPVPIGPLRVPNPPLVAQG